MKAAAKALAVCAAVFAGSAIAQSNLYVVGGVGQGKAKFSSADFSAGGAQQFFEEELGLAPGALAGAVSYSEDTRDMTWNLAVGYRFNRHFAAEVGYADLGEYSVRSAGSGAAAGTSDSSDYEVSAWKLSGVGLLPVGQGFSVLGKLGVALTTAENHFAITGFGADESGTLKKRRNRLFWGVGAHYDFSPKLGLRIEYEDYGKVGERFSGGDNAPGEAKISTLNLNVVYGF